jgi:SAM-dependent MidA family methyltransferase
MEEVLYHPEFGYYTAPRDPLGPSGDFYTSSDVDPVFAELLARKFTEMAAEVGIPPERFTIVELGAGRGLLAREILRIALFPYVIVERSAAMRGRQQALLKGLDVQWSDQLPAGLTGCIFSNEFFDALPVHRIRKRNGVLRELYVTADFTEVEADLFAALDVPLAEGQLADISTEGPRWIERIATSLECGFHLAIDYGYLDREFYARPHGTLMCYWRHRLVEDPYVHIGEQDITAHVNFSDLIRAGETSGLKTESFLTQMDFLIELGILNRIQAFTPVMTAEQVQQVDALKKLILPDRMGERFKVLIQSKGV